MTAVNSGVGLHLESGLWVDRPDALELIQEKLRDGSISSDEAEGLRHFIEDGYLVFQLEAGAAQIDPLVAGVDGLWRARPADLAYASDSPARPFARADEAADRHARYRIHDPHSHLDAARALYLDPQIFRWVRLILGDDAVAIQSLFFEYGSEQLLHRDPVVVPTGAPGRLLASWIALEDISPDCGALVYIPGSHRLPYYEFSPGQYEFDASRMGAAEVEAATAFDDEQARCFGLEPRLFTARRGEVLLWHANLRHGGAPVRDPKLTRKSFVVHYSTHRTYPVRAITVFDATSDGAEQPRIMETRRILEENGCIGFDNPMRGAARA